MFEYQTSTFIHPHDGQPHELAKELTHVLNLYAKIGWKLFEIQWPKPGSFTGYVVFVKETDEQEIRNDDLMACTMLVEMLDDSLTQITSSSSLVEAQSRAHAALNRKAYGT